MGQQELRNSLTSISCLREVPRQAREKHTWAIKPGPPLLDTANLHQGTKCKRLWILFLFSVSQPRLGKTKLFLDTMCSIQSHGSLCAKLLSFMPLFQSLSSLLISIMQSAQMPMPMRLQEEILLSLPFSS